MLNSVVIDTNILVAAAYNRHSASRQIVTVVEQEDLTLLVSPAILREYEAIVPRAVRSEEGRDVVGQILELAAHVTPAENPHVTEDREDDKFLAAAVAGGAEAIVTSDRHLLDVHPYRGIQIVRPVVFRRQISGS